MNLKTFKRLAVFTFITLVISSSFVCFTSSVWAYAVKELTLNQLVSFAPQIVRLTITDNRIEEDENGYIVNYVTGHVDEWVKGSGSDTLVFKQLAGISDQTGDEVFKSNRGLPRFVVGKTYFVFLAGESEKTGMRAPLGLYQGQLEMVKKNGEWVIPSLAHRKGLFKSMVSTKYAKALSTRALQLGQGVDDYETFKSAVKTMMGE